MTEKKNKPVDITKFTKKDFEGSAPYDFLYSLRSNGFTHAQVREKLAAHAKSVGYTAFKTTYAQYQKQMQQSNDLEIVENNIEGFDELSEAIKDEYISVEHLFLAIRADGRDLVRTGPRRPHGARRRNRQLPHVHLAGFFFLRIAAPPAFPTLDAQFRVLRELGRKGVFRARRKRERLALRNGKRHHEVIAERRFRHELTT